MWWTSTATGTCAPSSNRPPSPSRSTPSWACHRAHRSTSPAMIRRFGDRTAPGTVGETSNRKPTNVDEKCVPRNAVLRSALRAADAFGVRRGFAGARDESTTPGHHPSAPPGIDLIDPCASAGYGREAAECATTKPGARGKPDQERAGVVQDWRRLPAISEPQRCCSRRKHMLVRGPGVIRRGCAVGVVKDSSKVRGFPRRTRDCPARTVFAVRNRSRQPGGRHVPSHLH